MATDIHLFVHLERSDDRGPAWWAESPDLPGFSAADASLSGLQSRSQWAIIDILADRGEELGDLVVRLVAPDPETGNPARPVEEYAAAPTNELAGDVRVVASTAAAA